MKKQHLLFIPLLITLLAINSCIDDDGFFYECEHGEGAVVEEVLNLPEFTGVKLASSADVFITQGSDFEVVAKGERNLIDLLDLDVRNDIWEIEFEECVKNHDLEIFITMPIVDFLSISGSGEIIGETFIDAANITLRVTGSGDMCLGLFAENVDGKITGSGEMDLEGEGEFMDFDITGSGDLHAFDLVLEKADIRITGSGDAAVHVLEELKVRISGSGDVYFKGNPYLDIEISGSGDVIDAN